MFIASVGTATPDRRYHQKECYRALTNSDQFDQLSGRSRAILRKVLLGNNGVDSRYLALNDLKDAFELNPDALHRRFVEQAPTLATEAARRALAEVGVEPDKIDVLLISTCTGYLCPGLTSYVSDALGLRSDVELLDLVGQGCGAAIPNLRAAAALLASGRAATVISVCVEICSAAFYLDDDPGVLISACLFGDGAAAVILTEKPMPGRRTIRWRESSSVLSAADRDYLKFETRFGMLRNILAPQVPQLAAKHAESVLTTTLDRANIQRSEIAQWITHAGGKNVLDALSARLQLNENALSYSREILRTHGNMSSPSALFVLEHALNENAEGGLWWLSTFGAGFSSHGALLEVH